jgi:hypothetical protein
MRGLGAIRALSRVPQNRMFKLFARMERAGLEPATPSLQILLRGGLGGSVAVGAEEASRLARVASSTLVVVGRRDLTRI